LPENSDNQVMTKAAAAGEEAAESSSSAHAADLALARAAFARDRKALAELVHLLSAPLQRYVRSRLWPNTSAADDLVQEVFLALWRRLDRYEGQSALRTWVLGIARHKVEDYYRDRLRTMLSIEALEGPLEPEDPSPPDLQDHLLDQKKAGKIIWEILAALPEAQRLVLQWRYWEQRSAEEMAATLGRTEKSIERLLARARARFREAWLEHPANQSPVVEPLGKEGESNERQA